MNESTASKDPLAEITAMQKLVEALGGLEKDATDRVLRWAVEHYECSIGRVVRGRGGRIEAQGTAVASEPRKFTDLAELVSAARPQTDADRALVTAYWFQFNEGQTEFGAQGINTALKHLGYPV